MGGRQRLPFAKSRVDSNTSFSLVKPNREGARCRRSQAAQSGSMGERLQVKGERREMSLLKRALGVTRAGARWLPRKLRDEAERRLMFAIHQVTRVTNDHYPSRGEGEKE